MTDNYKVRSKTSSGYGGLVTIQAAKGSRSAAGTDHQADTDYASDNGLVDIEKLSTSEAGYRGMATETTLGTISTNLTYLSTETADATNTSTTSLTGGSTFTGSFVDLSGFEGISLSVRVDQDSTSNGLVVSWSDDGSNAIITQTFTVTASADFTEQLPRRARYYKVAYTNGGVTTTQLAITTRKLPRFNSLGTSNLPLVVAPIAGTNNIGKVTTIPTGAPTYANGQVATSTTSATLLAARSTRRYVLFKNIDASIVQYIGSGTVTSSNGYKLAAGEEVRLEITTQINAIAASGSPSIAYIECYD